MCLSFFARRDRGGGLELSLSPVIVRRDAVVYACVVLAGTASCMIPWTELRDLGFVCRPVLSLSCIYSYFHFAWGLLEFFVLVLSLPLAFSRLHC